MIYYYVNCLFKTLQSDFVSPESQVIDLKDQSFLKWRLDQTLIDETLLSSSVELMFRTRETKGNIFTMTNAVTQTILLQVNTQ